MSSQKNYYIGTLRSDSLRGSHRGWVMGVFMGRGARKTRAMEVKYWEFARGSTGHPTKTSATIEFTLILSGSVRGMIGGRTIRLRSGQYVVIRPGVVNNVSSVVMSARASGITVKAPSDPRAKKELRSS